MLQSPILVGYHSEIPYIGRYGGHSWKKLGSSILDAQAVFPLTTEILASKDYKQAPHVGGSMTI